MSLVDTSMPGRRWRRLFRGGAPKVMLDRPRLIGRILDAPEQWVAVHGTTGMGKSTLLRQCLEAARLRGLPTVLVALDERLADPTVLADYIRDKVRDLERALIIIDDIDWCDLAQDLDPLCGLFGEHPGFRFLTASADAPTPRVPAGMMVHLSAGDLAFTRPEVVELGTRWFGESMPGRTLDACWNLLRGGVAATVYSFERMGEDPRRADLIPQALLDAVAVTLDISTNLLPPYPETGQNVAWRTLSLMPELSPSLAGRLLGAKATQVVDEYVQIPGVTVPSATDRELIEWSPSFWHLSREFHGVAAETRLDLADRLLLLGERRAELWQRLLAGDWGGAERILVERFAEAAMAIPDGVVDSILATSPPSPDRFPLVAALWVFSRLERRGWSSECEGLLAGLAERRRGEASLQVDLVCAQAAAILGDRGGLMDAMTGILAYLDAMEPQEWVHLLPQVLRLLIHEGEYVAARELIFKTPGEPDPRHLVTLRAIEGYLLSEKHAEFIPTGGDATEAARLAAEIGPAAAAWLLLDHERQADVVDLLEPYLSGPLPRSGYAEPPERALIVTAYLAALLLNDESAKAARRFGRVSQREPLLGADVAVTVMGTQVLIACGDLDGAYRQANSLPEGHALRPVAVALCDLAAGNEVVMTFPRARIGVRAQGLRLVMEAVQRARHGDHDGAFASLVAALAGTGSWASGFAVRLMSASDRALLRGVATAARAANHPNSAAVVRLVGAPDPGVEVEDPAQTSAPLTRREKMILQGIALGLTLPQIAERDYVSVNTVKTQLKSLMRKLGVSGSREGAVQEARRRGIIG